MIRSPHAANSLQLLLVFLLATTTLLTSAKDLAAPRRQEGHGRVVPSTATLAGCQSSCGDLTFVYPFGIGSGCFRSPDFELTCDSTTSPPRLLFRDGITQIAGSINIVSTEFMDTDNSVSTRFSHTISMRNASVVSWSLSPKLLEHSLDAFYLTLWGLRFSGCDFDVYWLNRPSINKTTPNCTATCPKGESTGMVSPMQDCNGTGCCSIDFGAEINAYSSTLEFKFNNRSLSWDTIYITDATYTARGLSWKIADQPDCASARKNQTSYACVSNKSICRDPDDVKQGYNCVCRNGHIGNPDILDGCSLDSEYNPLQRKMNCIRQCGNISVPFPFGLEEGCFARKGFYLNCTNSTSSTLLLDDQYHVTNIYVDNGTLEYVHPETNPETSIGTYYELGLQSLYVQVGTPIVSVQWVAAHLTCQDAKRNSSGYACMSTNSECITSKPTDTFVGYRCKCAHGYQGNPNIINGCVGIVIGLSVGFGILLACLSGIYFIRRWRNGIQKQLRKKYFQKNKGLLLEQLICSNEKPSENKIFSLEELQKATNNFDPARILGSGGHGIVYKGILSDQQVVAIKKPKVIKEGEINQFINEVAILSQINHRNIVKLHGCCLETEVPLLVYDFIPNGSLFRIIHANPSNEEYLSWDDCLRIATEAAGALHYLHSAASMSVFHRDVKSSNILLDGKYTAKVSDFGASRLIPIDQSHVITNIQGTFGYLDPEYYHTGQLNEKSDVYSFGVVLVELLLRKEPIFTDESGLNKNLSNYFLWEIKARPIREIVASQVLEEATEDEINTIASLAEECLRLRGDERPTMKEVEMTLHFLHSKINVVEQSNNGRHPLQEPTRPPHHEAMTIDTGNKAILESSSCYNLEREFMSSASIPR
uniref:Protein kinase domain-containing protein n=1 Tax=Oryza rufipogon TaxID=4529 RepID=A0A0E0P7V5_ORYRU